MENNTIKEVIPDLKFVFDKFIKSLESGKPSNTIGKQLTALVDYALVLGLPPKEIKEIADVMNKSNDESIPEVKIPNDLDGCYKALELLYHNEDDSGYPEWLAMDEEYAVGMAHHNVGRWIRNNWKLWESDSKLHLFFNSRGIKHSDDMSSIILTSFHRLKNGKDIDLDSQLKKYWTFWIKEDVKKMLPPQIDKVDLRYINLYNTHKDGLK